MRWTLSRGGRQGGSSADGGAGTPQGRSPSPQQSPPVILDKILFIDVICILYMFPLYDSLRSFPAYQNCPREMADDKDGDDVEDHPGQVHLT